MKTMKILLITLFLFPLIALLMGYQAKPGQRLSIPIDQVTPEHKKPHSSEGLGKLFIIDHYKFPSSDIVITVNHFPFNIAGNRPYEIAVHGTKYQFDPKDVDEFIKKGKKLNIPGGHPLPTGTFTSDGLPGSPASLPRKPFNL